MLRAFHQCCVRSAARCTPLVGVACALSESRASDASCVRPVAVTCALSKLIEGFVQKTPPEKPEMDESRPQLSFGARNLKTPHATRAGRTHLSARAHITHNHITGSRPDEDARETPMSAAPLRQESPQEPRPHPQQRAQRRRTSPCLKRRAPHSQDVPPP